MLPTVLALPTLTALVVLVLLALWAPAVIVRPGPIQLAGPSHRRSLLKILVIDEHYLYTLRLVVMKML